MAIKMRTIQLENHTVPVRQAETVIMGSGAAGLCMAKRLYDLGKRDVVLLTNGLLMGTSRNTGSDKQTYYKLNVSGRTQDSIYEVAKTLFDGGATDGDTALAEAALSARCFYHLADLGVPFVQNEYGEFVGYKTDHDPKARAASAGPLTVQEMCAALYREVEARNIPVVEGITPVKILKDGKGCAAGLFCLRETADRSGREFVLFLCRNLVMATGAPAQLYEKSVFPESQIGATGVCLEAGAAGKNLTEWQYGLASTKFRWNVSGSYQQVLPRYVSTAPDGSDEREFLSDLMDDKTLLNAVFLKGYQWPFDAAKLGAAGSSWVDIAVYTETVLKGRRVYLDYMKNPLGMKKLDKALLTSECRSYLEASDATQDIPLERLCALNADAVQLYLDHGIDLSKEYLEVDVCAQHNNGGLAGDLWWETSVPGLFAVGEINGSHGVRRPGGSALNAGQVGAFRAAEQIARRGKRKFGPDLSEREIGEQVVPVLRLANRWLQGEGEDNLRETADEIRRLNSSYAGFVRNAGEIEKTIEKAKDLLRRPEQLRIESPSQLGEAFRTRDLLVCTVCYLTAMLDYIRTGGLSRGSYLVAEKLPDFGAEVPVDLKLLEQVQEVSYQSGDANTIWRPVRPLPESPQWFEQVWRDMKEREGTL